MSVTISGTNGIDKVQDGTIQSADFAAGVPGRSNLPAGTVLQVVYATTNTETATTSSTYSDTSLTATITPTASTSKIAVFITQNGVRKYSNNTYIGLKVLKNGSDWAVMDYSAGYNNSTSPNGIGSCAYVGLDSPGTTSALTYKTQFASLSNVAGVYVQVNNSESGIMLMEIAA